MEDVSLMFLCEEPDHQHSVDGSFAWKLKGVPGEQRLATLQPSLPTGLQVVKRAMSALNPQPTYFDILKGVTLPNLGPIAWDLRGINLRCMARDRL